MLCENILFASRRVCVCVCVWLAFLVLAPPLLVKAATLPIASIAAGKVVTINGQTFVKIGSDSVKGAQFMALQIAPVCKANEFNGINLQDFTPGNCACLPTPAAAGFTLAGTMIDERDGKSYEIRKFADGKCWMADNLKYGGTTDACASKTTFSGNGSATPTNRFGTGTYGDCRNNPSSSTYGYLYNWQAAMQHPSAYYNSTYTGPTSNVQGLCPAGWHLPSDKTTGEFATLDKANGGTGATQNPCTSASCNFWRPGYNYKGVYSGYSWSSGSLGSQGSILYLWSVSEYSVDYAWNLFVDSSNVYPGSDNDLKNIGLAVRCIKDTTDRTMQSFTTADCAAYPTPAANGYTLVGSLKDERDGKWYEIRKFADGKCWMADNLAYGGVTDACVSKTTFSGNGSATPTNTFGTGTYGDCRDAGAGGACIQSDFCDYCVTGAGAGKCGYYYNWQAAMQLPTGYYGSSVSYPSGAPSITNFHRGICPQGWHLPSGGVTTAASEFAALDIANGGTGVYQSSCATAACNFWRQGYGYKGLYAGGAYDDGTAYDTGDDLKQWSANEEMMTRAHEVIVYSSEVYLAAVAIDKSRGLTVRCIKD